MKLRTVFFFLFFICYRSFAQSYDELVDQYINQYKDIAIEEMQRTGIPASITLAQGIIESSAGQSPLTTQANNHFGVKCHDDWNGETYLYDDDRKNECFRKYPSALDSFKDHSDFLKMHQRYSVLFTYVADDYKEWAKGLKKCGYATNPHYAGILIKCIEDYDLHQWDLEDAERAAWFAKVNQSEEKKLNIKEEGNPEIVNSSLTSVNAEERISIFNNIKTVTLQPEESLKDLATTYEISMKRLLRYNDISTASQLVAGNTVYLQPKRSHGDADTVIIKEGETMFDIARDHGIQLDELYKKNLLDQGAQPASGQVIYLREKREVAPLTATAVTKDSVKISKISPDKIELLKPQYHVVAKGDTLFSISKKYNLTIDELKGINKLRSSQIYVGEKLRVEK
ncbi:MAG: LysM peptidoglycan-binding domain-containing protein [Chitinophagales bacterium]|nr:LysM peptidoglycan-binding domain-containing protein [Chitinophagales bacterium]